MALPNLSTEPEWEPFLHAADIPEEEASAYAKIFVQNRIKGSALPDFDSDLLVTLGITIIGDKLSIIRHAKTVCKLGNQPLSHASSSPAPFKAPSAVAKLPSINSEMTHQQFRKFRID